MRNDGRSIHLGHFQVAEDGGRARSPVFLFHERKCRLTTVGQKKTISRFSEHEL
jgi:hypothetical protein